MNLYEEDDFVVKRRRRSEPDFWHRLNRVLQFLVVIGFLLTLEREQSEKTAVLQKTQRELDLLRNDREYLETIARDRLNLMKPGETIFRIELPRS